MGDIEVVVEVVLVNDPIYNKDNLCYVVVMTKDEVLSNLKILASQLHNKQYITLADTRSIPGLEYYIYIHFKKIANALKEAGLPSSKLASGMNVKNEDILNYLRDLKQLAGKNPTMYDFYRDKELYKKYSDKKFSWSILKSRFGGLRKALEQMEKSYERNVTSRRPILDLQSSEQEKENPEFFQNKNRFYGKAAELHVTAELMYRGFQAANIPVDEGLDVLAVKSNKTFYFQVKHKDLNSNEHIQITKSSFERRGGGDVYYIFVLLSEEIRNFLIIPYHIINDWIRVGLADDREKGYSFLIKKIGGEYKLREVSLEKYLNRWEDVK